MMDNVISVRDLLDAPDETNARVLQGSNRVTTSQGLRPAIILAIVAWAIILSPLLLLLG